MSEEEYRDLMAKRGVKPLSLGSVATTRDDNIRQRLNEQVRKPRGPKYGNRKGEGDDGFLFDSTKELRRWQALQLRAVAGEIQALRKQVPYALVVNGVLVCQYIADFDYREGETLVVEDCKSPTTRKLAAYRIKAKLMQAIHGIQIREV